nr:MAG TPA: helix-turn-helix domain protein [Caudoviricetes sp.]
MLMSIEKVDIGESIEQKLNELGISKSEFGRKIGIPQQNVNRILSKSSIDTDKLVAISEALNFNFFDCYHSNKSNGVTADNGGVAVAGNSTAHHFTTNSSVETDAVLQERIKSLEALLAEKERLIKVYERMVEK